MNQPTLRRNRLWFGLELHETGVFLLYVVMVAFAVLYYQQSQDEGREWIIASSFSLPHLVFHVLHYEGHPPLLYALLWIPAHLHMPYTWINCLSAIVGTSSVYLLLRLSPFPFYIRALLPFCFALGYQESVVARSYVLIPLLGFLAAHLYRCRPYRPLALAAALALLANVSFHGTLVATGFAIAYGLRLRHESKSPTPSGPRQALVPRRILWQASALFIASLIFVGICIYPAKYSEMEPKQAIARMLHRVQGPEAFTSAAPGTAPSTSTATSAPTLTSTPAPARGFLQRHKETLRLVLAYPISSIAALAYVFEFLVILFLVLQRQWALLLPVTLLDYFLLFGYVAYRHTPLVWVTIILVLWAAWDTKPQPQVPHLQQVVAAAFALLCTLQIPWTVGAIHYELHHATYPAKATATYLKTLPPGTSVDGDATTYAVLPYRPGKIAIDRTGGRFTDHASYATSATIDTLRNQSSDILLLSKLLDSPESLSKLQASGYTETHTFCGGPYFPQAQTGMICFHVFSKR